MKTIFLIMLTTAAFPLVLFAQTDSARITSTYLGVFGAGTFYTREAWNFGADVTTRGGYVGEVPLGNNIYIDFWAGAEVANSVSPIFRFSVRRNFGPITFMAGHMPRPMPSVFRPFPLSGGGQFEPPALGALPGKGNGIILSWKGIQAGSFWVGKATEWNISFERPLGSLTIQGAGFRSSVRTGAAVGIGSDDFAVKGFWASDSIRSLFGKVKTAIGEPYATLVWNTTLDAPQSLEFGITQVFLFEGRNVLLGAGFSPRPRTVLLYAMVYL